MHVGGIFDRGFSLFGKIAKASVPSQPKAEGGVEHRERVEGLPGSVLSHPVLGVVCAIGV